MDLALTVLSGLLLFLGVVGCVVPFLPGPVLSFLGIATLSLTSHPLSWQTLLLLGGFTALVTVFDYIAPVVGAKWFKCSRTGMRFSLIGTVVGLFFLPFGILVGPLLGAIIGEMLSGKKFFRACWSGVGVFTGYVGGLVFKITFCVYLVGIYIYQIWQK
ncbi:MAG: DUF456 domain-containing protein [Kiritimatiellae bacterium]|nr:DUF456 domain-containing protein [Kiritimatiellia bacterium]